MGRYRKVDPKIWNDEKFRAFSDNGKLVFLYLLTHPHMTSLGAMRATVPGLAAELRWTEKAFRKAFTEATSEGLVEYDEKASFLALPNFLRYNPPENPNVVKSWRDQWDLVPECALKACLYQRVKAFTEGLGEAFAKALTRIPEHPLANPEPEPEPEPEPDKERESSGDDPPPPTIDGLVEQWNAIKGVTPCRSPSYKRITALQARIKDPFWVAHYAEALRRVAKSEFLRGNNDRNWVAGIDFFLRPDSVAKILEGQYDKTQSRQGRDPRYAD